ncbi:MAG: cryptochrome/photolyase family protein [Luteolibacter sp.]
MQKAIHWFRRDLRIADNTALHHATRTGNPVVPVYILSTWKNEHHWTGSNRQHFLCGCLESLAKNLETLSGKLIIRKGDQVSELMKLARETGATSIHFNKDPDPFGKETEKKLAEACNKEGIECHVYDDITLHTPDEILTKSDTPYKVFTPYSKNWLNLEKPKPFPKAKDLNTPTNIQTERRPTVSHWNLITPDTDLPEPGENAARKRMKNAVANIVREYSDLRDNPSAEATSRLSQDLRHGLISIRTLYQKVNEEYKQARGTSRDSIGIYIKELAWREFYFAIIHHFPKVLDEEFNSDWRGLPWAEPGKNFELWKNGQTGFPIVDAGMRQLLKTGFMHNRVRMITAMFLTKDLHIDWKLGESWFMQNLTDGEIASNNGGWQWSAGTGADAAPYFRIQNPWSQTARHDPRGKYIKTWIPELKDIDPKKFQSPPENKEPLHPDYPLPCVDHKAERERTLAIFKKHKNS